jgi:pimeloyl-ACP methyl ester carboxylesterase
MKSVYDLSNYIEDIELNGLRGRMINAPAANKQAEGVNILMFHGHHSSLERLAGVADLLSEYGNFCLPDMPGFGGMDPLRKVGLKPTIDNLADYMAAFIKLKYGSNKKFVVVGYSFGFLVLTRMLQKYPHLQKQCVDVIGLAGLLHRDEIVFSKRRRVFYMTSSRIIGSSVGSWIARELFMRKWFLASFYTKSRNAKEKFEDLDKQTTKRMVDFEVNLWRINDVPTWCYTTREMLNADLVTNVKQLDIPVIQITVNADKYFDNKVVQQHMHIVYKDVRVISAGATKHGASAIENAEDAMPFFPPALRKHLKSLR